MTTGTVQASTTTYAPDTVPVLLRPGVMLFNRLRFAGKSFLIVTTIAQPLVTLPVLVMRADVQHALEERKHARQHYHDR